MYKQFNLLELLSNPLQSRRTNQFIGQFGRNRSTFIQSPINGSDETHRMRIVTVKLQPLDRQSTPEMKPHCMRYKMYKKCSLLDRDRTLLMHFLLI